MSRFLRNLSFILPIVLLSAGLCTAQEAAVKAGKYDNGKMWTFDYPPTEFISETYGFTPDNGWFEKARLGSLRLPNCTASFVSPHGLVMTNHHCGRGSVAQVAMDGEDLLNDGFVSSSLDEERAVPGLYVDQLVAIQDVTDEVFAAVEDAETDAEKASARQEAIAAITNRITDAAGGADAGFVAQVINLYNGGRYSAYTFRRYSDVRLVMAPELQLGYFGGDTDNFTYPRYALDMTYFRVYENDEPFEPEYFFQWSKEGASLGDAVFVIGNPGSTLRLETMAQLEWRRDVQEKAIVDLLNSRIGSLMSYYEDNPSPALLNQIFGLRNAQKLYTGRVKGLNDMVIMAKRADTERQFLSDMDAKFANMDADVQVPYLTVINDLANIVEQKREFAAEFAAFIAMQPGGNLSSATLGRASVGRAYLNQKDAGATAEQLQPYVDQMSSMTQDPTIDKLFLANRLADFKASFGDDDPIVQGIMKGMSPAEVAESITSNSVFSDAAKLMEAMENDGIPADDPALGVANMIADRLQAFQSAFAGLGAQETELNAQHGRARFEIYGTERPPDATFSLRIADGVVSPYEYNGTEAPPFTTFFGLYNRYHAHMASEDGAEWVLPERWLNPPATFDMSTKLNLVSTNDIIGGNSGSPLLNKDLEVVGLIFDGNIESLPSAFIYQTEVARAVSVDVRGMREALDEIYDVDRIVLELDEGVLVATEAEADARQN
ncbi:MAG: S46 family peptidase [Rhodothermales bacterium]|nr:S46 family peptidase [Rhodothermales bacterium]